MKQVRHHFAPPARRRGFMLMLVLSVLVFLAGAIIAMSTLFAHEARRTHVALAQTQLRQLLIAAVPAAEAEIKAHPENHDAAMLVPVEGAVVTLHVTADTVEIEAAYRGQRATQKLSFAGGRVIAVTLEQSGI